MFFVLRTDQLTFKREGVYLFLRTRKCLELIHSNTKTDFFSLIFFGEKCNIFRIFSLKTAGVFFIIKTHATDIFFSNKKHPPPK